MGGPVPKDLASYYESYGDLIRDDEAFWVVFLEKCKYDVDTFYLPYAHAFTFERTALCNVGTYRFTHLCTSDIAELPQLPEFFRKIYENALSDEGM